MVGLIVKSPLAQHEVGARVLHLLYVGQPQARFQDTKTKKTKKAGRQRGSDGEEQGYKKKWCECKQKL